METRQRHGCLTTWLIFMIIGNSITAASYLLMGDIIAQNLPNPIPQPIMTTLIIVSILNLLLAIMLFQWKKWAFWVLVGTSIIALIINLSLGLGIGTSLFGLSGIAILFGVLQMKKNGVTAWENLN